MATDPIYAAADTSNSTVIPCWASRAGHQTKDSARASKRRSQSSRVPSMIAECRASGLNDSCSTAFAEMSASSWSVVAVASRSSLALNWSAFMPSSVMKSGRW
ncbi:hypothetical protein ACFFX0_25600 [Citricoccus parietis]|uniref:Uncharacterized protein n=1 Tax=Citricoccus parietis TaxID=592307 RepID=A0ABV5G626_9MICC